MGPDRDLVDIGGDDAVEDSLHETAARPGLG
jgi:hypothetical protein